MHMNSYHIRVAGREDESFLREMLYESLYVPEGRSLLTGISSRNRL